MIKVIPSLLRKFTKINSIIKVPIFSFGRQYTIDPMIQHYGDIMIRHSRRIHLDAAVLNQNKDVMWGEIRKPTDSMINLKQKGKCPAVIQSISNKVEDQIDIVLDYKKLRRFSKLPHYGITPVYVRVQGKQYRCFLQNLDYHADGFVMKAYLRQYIPGQPNKLSIPVELTHIFKNPYVMTESEGQFKRRVIDIICYNQEYPMRFYIDVSYVSPERPYRVGDLANLFPPGILLHPKYSMNDKIFEVDYVNQPDNQQQILQKAYDSGKKQKQQRAAAKLASSGGAAGTGAADASKDKAGGGNTAANPSKGGGKKQK